MVNIGETAYNCIEDLNVSIEGYLFEADAGERLMRGGGYGVSFFR